MSYLINLHKCGLERMNGGTINIHNAHCVILCSLGC